jgi:hypothetical protein
VTNHLRLLPASLVLGLVTQASAAALGSGDEQAIRKQLDGYAAARTQGSGEKQASFYAEDADEWELFARTRAIGRTAIAKLLDLPPEAGRRFRLEIINIIPLGADSALVDAHWFRETSERPKGRVHYIMVKKDSVWMIQAARINPYPAQTNP